VLKPVCALIPETVPGDKPPGTIERIDRGFQPYGGQKMRANFLWQGAVPE
jgi:hypothetical protein